MPNEEIKEYPWYSIVPNDKPLQQGDLFDGINVYFPVIPEEKNAPVKENEIYEYDVVVMTQSCDLVDIKDESLVLLCPRSLFVDMFEEDKRKDYWNKLRKGSLVQKHLINKCDIKEHEFDYQVVLLDTVISMRFDLLREQLKSRPDRVRMLPPYREFMAQAFARQFMRIGLPNDIPLACPY